MNPGPHYFVLSHSDAPERIVFTEADAFASESVYIDVFDSKGEKVKAWRLMPSGEYTDTF